MTYNILYAIKPNHTKATKKNTNVCIEINMRNAHWIYLSSKEGVI